MKTNKLHSTHSTMCINLTVSRTNNERWDVNDMQRKHITEKIIESDVKDVQYE